MRPYQWLLAEQAFEVLENLPKQHRRAFVTQFDLLARNPFRKPDLVCDTPDGGEFCVMNGPRGTIIYSVDHAVRQIHVLNIEPYR